MDNCIFCKILANQIPSSKVYSDDLCTAFLDIRPVNTGHLLVIPNEHSSFLSGLEPDTGAQMFRVAQRLAQALRDSGVPCDGINLLLADGEVAGQEVFHVHLHVFPRFTGDGFRLHFGPSYGASPAKAELDAMADRIRAVLS
jgi:histidine triad (HIT) family protein